MAKPTFSPNTQLAIKAARQAGEAIIDIYQDGFTSSLKNDRSPVTEADIKSNEILLRELSVLGYPILSEESVDNSERLTADTIWIIDPLDGTSDFINRTDEFSVMIALVRDQVPVTSLIYQPTKERLFVGEQSKGAWVLTADTAKRLRVSSRDKSPRVITSRSHFSEDERIFLDKLSPRKHRQMGSAGLKVAEVASARADLYFTTTNKIKQWDTAAAYCLINEAGGQMTDMKGGKLRYNTKNLSHRHGILVSNGLLHHKVIACYLALPSST